MGTRNPEHAKEERIIFDAFLKSYPSFASEVKSVIQPHASFPDVTITLQSGLEIDFELGEWLNGQQMQCAKETERKESAILDAIGDQEKNKLNHFRFVMLKLRSHMARFDRNDSISFRSELFKLIEETDRRWPNERFWHSPQGYWCRSLDCYPILRKYLESVYFDPIKIGRRDQQPWPSEQPWIVSQARGGSYTSETAVEALIKIIKKKLVHYACIGDRSVQLLIYYSKAALYNTPYLGVQYRSFEDLAVTAANSLAGREIYFEKLYLLNALNPGLKTFEIHPKLTECT